MKDAPRGPRRKRHLTPGEQALWAKVAESIRPLPGRNLPPPSESEPQTSPAAKAGRPPEPAPLKRKKALPPLAPLEPKLARNLRRGADVDARLDLHGYRQDEAHTRLVRFLRTEQERGARVVLVITGKGRRDAEAAMFEERGVLRRLVPVWLAEPVLRDVVIGFSEAAQPHGGAGALYVRLRRSR